MLDLTLSFVTSLEEPKYKYITNESTGQSLAKGMGNSSRVSENPVWPPLHKRGHETPGHERDFWVGVVSEGFMEEQGLEPACKEQMNE